MSVFGRAAAAAAAADGPRLMRKHTEIESLRTMECDTPVYDDFVQGFVARHGAGGETVVELARRYCETWPVPRAGDSDNSNNSSSSSEGALRVGVMDSSFNPPHYCHGAYMECLGIMELLPASGPHGQRGEARVLGIDAYLMLLGASNADKAPGGATLEQRMRMVDMLATTVVQDTAADTWHLWKSREQFDATNLHNMAIGMVNTPRFVDKCRAVEAVVRREWARATGRPAAAAPRVLSYFAMGWDTLIRFFDARYYADYRAELDAFFERGGRIAYSRRVGFPDKDVDAFFARPELAAYLQYIFELRLPKRVKHISSSDVRLAVRDSTQSVRDIPPRILEFVNATQLYRQRPSS
ncbi:hypothetical protein H4R18_000885 [Coemansia javaensis]|uniref:Nicotinamide-nucleotide adenylyltransferase n=1 Tax=Coemansia javaensis TaxID=2761396 RepID=A0A9W8HN76_9FUNG|nr:hypothetical protein H4R18_000885 [Coemansia javaensis]